jgi:hypothetical protein
MDYHVGTSYSAKQTISAATVLNRQSLQRGKTADIYTSYWTRVWPILHYKHKPISAHSWRSNTHWLACMAPPLLRPEYKAVGLRHASSSHQSITNTHLVSEDRVCQQEHRNRLPDTTSTAHTRQLLLQLRPASSTSLLCLPVQAACIPAGLITIASPLPWWLCPDRKHLAAHKEDTSWSHDRYRLASIPHHRSTCKPALFKASLSPACHKEDATSLPLLAQASRYRRNFGHCASGALSFSVCVCAYNSTEHLL